MNKKKISKIGAIIFALFALTGCTTKAYSCWGSVFLNFFSKISMWFNNLIGSINAFISNVVLGLFNFSPSAADFIDLIFSYYSSALGKIITVVQILAIVAIVIQFAKSVVKSNITGEGLGQSPIQHLKRVTTAVIVTFLIPYICVSGFMLSTYAAVATTNLFSEISTADDNAWKIYGEMYEDHVNLGTLCGKGQNEKYGVSNFKDFDATTDHPEKVSKPGDVYDVILEDGSPKASTGDKTLHEKYCSTGEVNVFNSIKYSSQYGGVLIVGGAVSSLFTGTQNEFIRFLSSILELGFGGITLHAILSLLFSGGIIFAFFFILLATMRRIVDLIVLVAMSWWYVGSYVADSPSQNSIGELAKKLLSICLTNFLMLFEFFLCIFTVLGHGFTFVTALMCVVWIKVLTATPTAVEEMVQSTGSAEDAARLGNRAASFVAKMMK